MAHLFYNTLGNLGLCDPALSNISTCSGPQTGFGLSNTGPFSNIQDFYWSGTEYAPSTSFAWGFHFLNGNQEFNDKTNTVYAWAVHSGDVAAVPEPSTLSLLGVGLLGLFMQRKRVA